MKRRLIIILVLLVFLPLAVLGWLGVRVSVSEREVLKHQLDQTLVEELRVREGAIQNYLSRLEQDIAGTVSSGANLRDNPQVFPAAVRQYFEMDTDGRLTYPNPKGLLSEDEQGFFERTQHVWAAGSLANPAQGEDGGGTTKGGTPRGWHTWYWGEGLNFIHWWRGEDGRVVGVELNRARLIADIIALLPYSDPDGPEGYQTRVVLRDSQDRVLYQFGRGRMEEDAPDRYRATLKLGAPLSGWTYEHAMVFSNGVPDASAQFGLVLSLTALALALVGLAVYLYREHTREMREATQRVSFVNQVSHELRTPLTNIRMYAELLSGEWSEDEERPRKYLDIIVSESKRLSRLIANVLTFSRHQRSTLTLHRSPTSVDEVLAEVVEQFEPALKGRGITPVFHLGTTHKAQVDRDALEQIVGNLLSNVEKYAQPATEVIIRTQREGDRLSIFVMDDGPGIPREGRKRLFEAFYRVRNRLTEGVTGTGIGLSIARNLARLHGGDLELMPSEQGAHFHLCLHAPISQIPHP